MEVSLQFVFFVNSQVRRVTFFYTKLMMHARYKAIVESIFLKSTPNLHYIYLQKYLINFRELLLKRKINQLDRL